MKTFNKNNLTYLGLLLVTAANICHAQGAGDAVISDAMVMGNEASNVKSFGGAGIDLNLAKLPGMEKGLISGKQQIGSTNTRTTVNSIYSEGGAKISGAMVMNNHATDILNFGSELTVNSIVAKQ